MEKKGYPDPDSFFKRIIITAVIFAVLSFILFFFGDKWIGIAIGMGAVVSIIFGVIHYILLKKGQISKVNKLIGILSVILGILLVTTVYFRKDVLLGLINFIVGIVLVVVGTGILKKK